MANYQIENNAWYEDVRFLDGKQYNGSVDLFCGGSPCQSFSTYGKKKGLEDARGTLFYDYARLIKEISPKVFIYENVKGLLTHDKGRTWEIIKNIFKKLNYKIYPKVLDAQHFGLPQMRERIFVVGIRNDIANYFFSAHWPVVVLFQCSTRNVNQCHIHSPFSSSHLNHTLCPRAHRKRRPLNTADFARIKFRELKALATKVLERRARPEDFLLIHDDEAVTV